MKTGIGRNYAAGADLRSRQFAKDASELGLVRLKTVEIAFIRTALSPSLYSSSIFTGQGLFGYFAVNDRRIEIRKPSAANSMRSRLMLNVNLLQKPHSVSECPQFAPLSGAIHGLVEFVGNFMNARVSLPVPDA